LSTATQRALDAHEIPVRTGAPGIAEVLQLAPAPGAVVISARPFPSTATQSALEAQEIPASAVPGSISTRRQEAPAPAVGLVLISASPASSTAAQSEVEAQETPVRDAAPGILAVLKLSEGAATAGADARQAAAAAAQSAVASARALPDGRRFKRTTTPNTDTRPLLRSGRETRTRDRASAAHERGSWGRRRARCLGAGLRASGIGRLATSLVAMRRCCCTALSQRRRCR
jgi:hypothetical protein